MPTEPATIEPTGPDLVEPIAHDTVAPGKECLGLICANCGKTFSLIGPLDPDKVPPDRPIDLHAESPILHGTCSHCGHKADYPIEQLQRMVLA